MQQEQHKFGRQFFLKSKANGCGSISTVFSSIVFLFVSSITIIIIIIIIIKLFFHRIHQHGTKFAVSLG